jgi:phage shock protein A
MPIGVRLWINKTKNSMKSHHEGEWLMSWQRIWDYLVATYHEIINDADKPEAMLKRHLRNIEKEISAGKAMLAKQQLLTEQYRRQASDAGKLAEKRAEQARIAKEAGEEELANRALAEEEYYLEKVKEYEGYAQKSTTQTEALRHRVSQLEKKYLDLKDKKNELVARAEMAKANQRVQAMLHFTTSDTLLKEFQRIEERIAEMEMKTQELAGENPTEAKLIPAPSSGAQIALNPAEGSS